MPTIEKIWEKKDRYTKSASELSRNLCFAGLAVVWIFRVPNGNQSAIPPALMWCALGFVVALGLDLFQYLVGTERTKAFGNKVEDEIHTSQSTVTPINRATHEFLYPDSHRTAMDVFWGLKVLVTLITWIVLAVFVGIAAVNSTLPKLS